MRVNIETVVKLMNELENLNKLPLSEIEFYRDGKKVVFDKRISEDWVFTEMSNAEFINVNLLTEYEYNVLNHPSKIDVDDKEQMQLTY
jgi:hypothetical protein